MSAVAAHIRPEVLRWARESSGYTVVEVAHALEVFAWQIEAAEHGDDYLTLPQAERAAALFDRPLAALFLPKPPEEESPETQFRRLRDAPELPWPPAMHALARRVRQRQGAVAELLEDLDEQPVWPAVYSAFQASSAITPAAIRDLLGVSAAEQQGWLDSSGYKPLRHWIDAVESLGVLVMQNGEMPTTVMRAFAAPHDQVPAVVLNNQDDPRARAFSLVHELGHLLASVAALPAGVELEQWCDTIASEVLMPAALVAEALSHTSGPASRRIRSAALRLGVTPFAAAVRIKQLRLVDPDSVEALIVDLRVEHDNWTPGGSGGDYYLNEISRLGPSYIRTVFSALESEALSYNAASDLLDGVKIKNFSKLRSYLDDREASE